MADLKDNLNDLMEAAKKMQVEMQGAQKELEELEVTGEAGGGLVKATINGRHYVKSIFISDSLMDEDEDGSDMIVDLMVAAINDATNKIEKESRNKINKLTAGLNLPTDFQLDADNDDDD